MSRTRELYHANPHQPHFLVRSLLRDEPALDTIARLLQGRATRTELTHPVTGTSSLRKLMRLELVASYNIGGTFYYQLRHVPAYLATAARERSAQPLRQAA